MDVKFSPTQYCKHYGICLEEH